VGSSGSEVGGGGGISCESSGGGGGGGGETVGPVLLSGGGGGAVNVGDADIFWVEFEVSQKKNEFEQCIKRRGLNPQPLKT